jgi:hypothetical protein
MRHTPTQANQEARRLAPGFLRSAIVALASIIWLSACGSDEVSTLSVSELAAQSERTVKTELQSDKVIPRTDLPPEGTRSIFDHLIANHGQIPYPFEKMIELTQLADQEGRQPTNLMIPNGRSLLKGQANFSIPRVLVAVDGEPVESEFELPPILKGRLFFTFVEGANEIEVVSYNEAAGRFEFQLVKNYCKGCNPELVYAKRAICSTCHQGGAPIFPVRPWEETNGQAQIANAIKEAHGSNIYQGLNVSQSLIAPERFDERTDIGNTIVALQKIWIDGCGPDDSCRSGMLKLALEYLWNPGGFDPNSAPANAQKQMQKAHWPAEGIALRNGDLPNRDPLTEIAANQGFFDKLIGLFGREEVPGHVVGEFGMEEFEKLPPLRIDVDPLTPRAPRTVYQSDSLEGVIALAQMFSAGDQARLEKASQWSLEAIQRAVDKLETPAQAFSRIRSMQALLAALGAPVPETQFLATENMSAPIADGAPPLDIPAGSVLNTFETYCFACHRGNPAAKLDFMNGEEEQIVLQRVEETTEISDALDYKRYLNGPKASTLMPPADSYQREMLDAARAKNNGDLEKMQNAIPGLFDF